MLESVDQPNWDDAMFSLTEKEAIISQLKEDFAKQQLDNIRLKRECETLTLNLKEYPLNKSNYEKVLTKCESVEPEFSLNLNNKVSMINVVRDLSNLVNNLEHDISSQELLDS